MITMANLVHYCPGSAVGSPAGLTRAEAEYYLAQDTDFINTLVEADALEKPVIYPHIGGECARCREHTKKCDSPA